LPPYPPSIISTCKIKSYHIIGILQTALQVPVHRCRIPIDVQRVEFKVEGQSRRKVGKAIEGVPLSMLWGGLRWLCVVRYELVSHQECA
jgi:hypothetical protein